MAALSTSTPMGQVLRDRPRMVVAGAALAIAAAATVLGAGAVALLADTAAPVTTNSRPDTGLMLQHVLRENGRATAINPGAPSLESYRQHVLRENGRADGSP